MAEEIEAPSRQIEEKPGGTLMSQEKILRTIHQPGSWLAKYQRLFVGSGSILFLIRYELIMMFVNGLPGALGLFLRKLFYPILFKKVGKGVIFGRNITIRHPQNIEIGDRCVFDDGCVLDAKGDPDVRIRIGSDVFISRNAIIGCKDGHIELGNDISVGPQTFIQSVEKGAVKIGDHCIIAPNCYIIGAANYGTDRIDIPMSHQGLGEAKGVTIHADVWIGSSVIVLDGVVIERGSVVGAHSLVKHKVPAFSVVFGIPATVKYTRSKSVSKDQS